MKEREMLAWTMELAARTGWVAKHVPAPMLATRQGFVGAKQASGLPDIIMTCSDPPRLIFCELKGDGGTLSDDQRAFLFSLQRVAETRVIDEAGNAIWGQPKLLGVYAWWPKDRPTIETILVTKTLL